MPLAATFQCGDALVVFEGPRRIRRAGTDGASVTLWPDDDEAQDIRRRLDGRRPILVILGGPQADAALLTEQFVQAPPALAAAVRSTARDMTGTVVPALDWLPAELRDRGLRFLRASAEHARRIPAPLCQSLYLDEGDPATPHVRFAHRIDQRPPTEHDLERVVAYAFADLGPTEATA
jgi:hypothetical protein